MALLNGRLPLSSLVHVGTDAYGRAAYLATDAAASWARMRAAGMPMDLSDSYRDYARQEQYWRNPPNSLGWSARPGTSTHGWGRAVDARGACLSWLARYGAAYGWIRTIPAETWHYEYIAARDISRPPAPTTPAWEDDDMLSPEARTQVQQAAHQALIGVLRSDELKALIRAQVRAEVADLPLAILDAKVSDDTGTLAQTVRDTRRIARRHEKRAYPDS